jgi:hypothetical protein
MDCITNHQLLNTCSWELRISNYQLYLPKRGDDLKRVIELDRDRQEHFILQDKDTTMPLLRDFCDLPGAKK